MTARRSPSASRPRGLRPPRHARQLARFVAPARARPAVWRLALGLVLVICVQAAALAATFTAVSALAGPDAAGLWTGKLAVASTPASALWLLASFLPLLAGVALAARLLHRRGPGSLMGARPLRQAARGAGVTFAVFAPLLAATVLLGATRPNLPPQVWALVLLPGLAGVAVQTLAEETLFRGYLMQQLAARVRSPLVWAGLPALLFGLLHLDPGRLGAAAPLMVVGAVLFGLVAADLTARSGGLGLAWGMHFANNAVGLLLLGTPGSITGLSLRVSTTGLEDLATAPLLLLVSTVPLVLAWLILRSRLPD
jgi:hypothetical protein